MNDMNYMNKINANSFICLLSEDKQEKIRQLVSEYLIAEGYGHDKIKEVISNVMDDRLWILQDVIDIKQFMT